MTEEEWLACDDPRPMLNFLQRKATERKLRLLGVGILKHWPGKKDQLTKLMKRVEQFADGTETTLRVEGDFVRPHGFCHAMMLHLMGPSLAKAMSEAPGGVHEMMQTALSLLFEPSASDHSHSLHRRHSLEEVLRIRAYFAQMVREVFGNPFRTQLVDPRWLTSSVLDLASHIYQMRKFGPMPFLGDALADAGCDRDDMLAHLYGDGTHVRGCWVLDMLLGKTFLVSRGT